MEECERGALNIVAAFLSDYLLSKSRRDKGLVPLCGRWLTMGIEEWHLKKKKK